MAFEREYEDVSEDPGPNGMQRLSGSRERQYLIPAHDQKGHSSRVQFRLMPAHQRILQDVVSSKKFPFRTVGDLMRYCVTSRAAELAKEEGIRSVQAQANAMIAALQDEEFQIQFQEHFTLLRRVTDHYIEAKAPQEARRVVAQARMHIEAMPDDYWKQRYEKELLDRFGALLDAGVAAWGNGE